MRLWMWSAALAVSLLAVPAPKVSADGGHGGMMHGQMQGGAEKGAPEAHSGHELTHLLKHAKELGLTSEQVSKLKGLQFECQRNHVRLEADIKIAHLELRALTEQEHAELPAIQAKVDQLKKAEGALLMSGITATRDALALLTPEQREKNRAHHEQMKSGGGQHSGGGMGGMGGGMGGMSGGMSGGGHGGQGGGGHDGGHQH